MNTDTGKIGVLAKGVKYPDIKEALESIERRESFPPFISVETSDMTPKQKEIEKVSPYDNRSKLGKTFTQLRKEKRAIKLKRREK